MSFYEDPEDPEILSRDFDLSQQQDLENGWQCLLSFLETCPPSQNLTGGELFEVLTDAGEFVPVVLVDNYEWLVNTAEEAIQLARQQLTQLRSVRNQLQA